MTICQALVQAGLNPCCAGILHNDRVYREALRRVREKREQDARQKDENKADRADRNSGENGQDEPQQAPEDTGAES